jgi:hypothetical protein
VVEPKTVSNLPLDVSIRWAEDQKLLQETKPIIQESKGIRELVQTEVISPAPQSQIELLLNLAGLHPTWALFEMPPGYAKQRRRIFTSKLAACLVSDEQQDALISRIESAKGADEDKQMWEEEKEHLMALLKLMNGLNKDLIDIISRCTQYQKG